MPDADYDRFAWVYNKHWGGGVVAEVLPVLEQLCLRYLPAGARILDLCCGTGQLAAALTRRGFHVTGVDASSAMLAFAEENAPGATFLAADARTFVPPSVFQAVVSTYDSLNHLLTPDGLTQAFRNVYHALENGGRFVFDLNMEAGYAARWQGSFGIVEDDHVCVVRAEWRPEDRLGRYRVTLFTRSDHWQRSDLTLTQRCHPEAQVRAALARAGFADVEVYDALQDLAMPRSVGRAFFVARRGAAARSGDP